MESRAPFGEWIRQVNPEEVLCQNQHLTNRMNDVLTKSTSMKLLLKHLRERHVGIHEVNSEVQVMAKHDPAG